jgi:SulP family sulfate permease
MPSVRLRTLSSYVLPYFLQPVRLLRGYARPNLRADLMAALTVGVILLPQAIAFALVAELPPEAGLYAAVVGAIVGALWGSSRQNHTGPTSALSLLVLSAVAAQAASPGTGQFLVAVGVLSVIVGVVQLGMGLARLGVLVNFVSDSVIVGFAAGAGIQIALGELRHLLGLSFSSQNLLGTASQLLTHLPATHMPTLALGLGVMGLSLLVRRLQRRLPDALISLVVAAAAFLLLGLDRTGVRVIGELPSSLPPLAGLPLFDFMLIARLSTGALAVAAIGLIQTMAVARDLAVQTGERLDNNQEFVGQGLANIACGFLSGYPVSGSLSRAAVNKAAGARTPLAAVFSGLFVLVAMSPWPRWPPMCRAPPWPGCCCWWPMA